MNKIVMIWIFRRHAISETVTVCISFQVYYTLCCWEKTFIKVAFLFCFQIDKEQSELARANFSILRKEAQAILNLVGLFFLQH